MFRRDILFVTVVGALCVLHIDIWAWGRIGPILFGWMPYHIWYSGALTLAGTAFFAWWVVKMWPVPEADNEE